jgi:small subunit ribosomal protein S17
MENKRKLKTLTGKVVKLSTPNTIKVRVEKKYAHPKYGKTVKEHKNYVVDIADSKVVAVGDIVEIGEGRKISPRKSWVFLVKIKKHDTEII